LPHSDNTWIVVFRTWSLSASGLGGAGRLKGHPDADAEPDAWPENGHADGLATPSDGLALSASVDNEEFEFDRLIWDAGVQPLLSNWSAAEASPLQLSNAASWSMIP